MSLDMHGVWPSYRRALICLLLGAVATSALAPTSSANPGTPGPDFDNGEWLLLYLVVTNWPIDLFCFSLIILFMCRVLGGDVGKIWKRSGIFLGSVVLASLAIALAGALIDFYSFYEASSAGGYSLSWGSDGGLRVPPKMYLALMAIFFSVLVVSLGIVRTSRYASFHTAVAMTGINFASWMLILYSSGFLAKALAILTAISCMFLAIVPLYYIWKWHDRSTEKKPLSVLPERLDA